MDKCSCLNPEALIGVLKTVYLFLESQNFRATCDTFLSESRGMGYEQLKQAIACILVLKPRPEMVTVGRVSSSKGEMAVEADIVHEYDNSGWPNTYYGEPLCLRCLATDSLTPEEIARGICPCKDHCPSRKNIGQTVNDTTSVSSKSVNEEVKLAPPPQQSMSEPKSSKGEKKEEDKRSLTPENDVKDDRSSVGSEKRGDGRNKEELRGAPSKQSLKMTVEDTSSNSGKQIAVTVRTETYMDNISNQENRSPAEPPVLKPIPFVESAPFISKTSLDHPKALDPTSSVRFEVDGHVYAVSRETQVTHLPDATVVTTTVVKAVPSGTDFKQELTDIPSTGLRSVHSGSPHEEFTSKMISVPNSCCSSEKSSSEHKIDVVNLEACLEKPTKSAHTSADVDAVERSASTHSLNARYQLDYSKVKRELRWGCPSIRTVLLQALRWRLTRSDIEVRNEIMSDYARHDLLSLHGSPKSHTTLVEEFLCSKSRKLASQHEEGMARMLNAMASLTMGRDYLCQDHTLLTKLIIPLLMHSHPSKTELSPVTSDYLWVTLQKLSLRNNMRVVMIQSGLAEYLVSFLAQHHNLISDYCLEYCLALFMNLCLHPETHTRLSKKSKDTVKFISDFLSANHDACLSYINGAMYSLFMDPDIRKAAKDDHLDMKISEKTRLVDEETRQQLEVIFDVLSGNKPVPDCNTCDCIDQDDEVDHLEDEIEHDDLVRGSPDGENLLSLYRGECGFMESLIIPLTCICRPATPCKKISAMERCPECEQRQSRTESSDDVKTTCCGLCKKSKGHETVRDGKTVWDDETVLACEMCPHTDNVCCVDEDVSETEPTTEMFVSLSASVIRGDNTVSVVVEDKPAPISSIMAGSHKSLASSRPRSVTLPVAEKTGVITVTSTRQNAMSGTPSTISVEYRIPVEHEVEHPPISPSEECLEICCADTKSSQTPCNIQTPPCPANEEGMMKCHECCNFEMKQISESQPWQNSVQPSSMHSLLSVPPTIPSKRSVNVPEDDDENEISIVVQSTHKPRRDGSTNTVITTIVKSQSRMQPVNETATATTAGARYAEPVPHDPTFKPVDREDSFLRDDIQCEPGCLSNTGVVPHEELRSVKDNVEPSRSRSTKSATPPASKPEKAACCVKPTKSSHAKNSKLAVTPTRKSSTRSSFKSADYTHSFLRDNIQFDNNCSKPIPTIKEVSHDNIPSRDRTLSACCARARSSEQSGKPLVFKGKLYDRSRSDNVPPSFTRASINQPSKITLQCNPYEQNLDETYICQPCKFSQQSNLSQSIRPYCYSVTKNICRNPTCSCPNESAKMTCTPRQQCQVCPNQICPTPKSKYACECYNHLQQFSQSADLNRMCRKSSDDVEKIEETKEGNEVTTPEAEYQTLLQALADSDNLCELGVHETFRYIDCECYVTVFQSRPKLQRTP